MDDSHPDGIPTPQSPTGDVVVLRLLERARSLCKQAPQEQWLVATADTVLGLQASLARAPRPPWAQRTSLVFPEHDGVRSELVVGPPTSEGFVIEVHDPDLVFQAPQHAQTLRPGIGYFVGTVKALPFPEKLPTGVKTAVNLLADRHIEAMVEASPSGAPQFALTVGVHGDPLSFVRTLLQEATRALPMRPVDVTFAGRPGLCVEDLGILENFQPCALSVVDGTLTILWNRGQFERVVLPEPSPAPSIRGTFRAPEVGAPLLTIRPTDYGFDLLVHTSTT
jgi:hypothetical protein